MTETAAPDTDPVEIPSIERIREVAATLSPRVLRTPTVPWSGFESPIRGDLLVKLECLQITGSFKARGALNTLLQMPDLSSGVVAFSAGNHAIAAAWAGRELGVDVTVVMPRSANAARVARVESLGARLIFGESIADLFAIVEQLQREEGRALFHPFEGPAIVEGTATVALEAVEDAGEFDAVYVPIGGGGLIAGMAAAFKQLTPACRVIGVEPEGADGMRRSLANGSPLDEVIVDTIADSLGAPMHRPYTFSLVQQCVDDVVTVTDEQIRHAMRRLFADMKLAVEPACASSLAALMEAGSEGRHAGDRVLVLACGSNIDTASWCAHAALDPERVGK